jgi:O-antigen/teichoic acid export membrane protein
MLASLARGSASLLSGMVLRKVLLFAAVVVAVRTLSPDQYGAYVLFEAILALLLLLSDFGLVLSSTRLIAAEAGAKEKALAVGSAVALRLLTLGVFGLLLFPARLIVRAVYHSPLLDDLMAYMPAVLLLAGTNELFTHFLLGMHRHGPMAIAQLVSGATNLAGVIVFVWLERFGVVGLVWSVMLAAATSLAFQYVAAVGRARIRPSLGTIRRLLHSGFPLQLNSLLTIAIMRLDTFLIGVFAGPAAVATYGIAMKLPDNMRYLLDSHRLVYFSTASKHFSMRDLAGIREALETSVRWVTFIFFGTAILAVAWGRDVIVLLFSRQYLSAAPALPLLVVAMGLFVVNSLFGSTLIAGGRVVRLLYVNALTAVVSVGANVILIPRLGFMGAAVAAVLAHSIAAVAYVWSLESVGLAFRVACLLRPVTVFAVLFAAILFVPWQGLLFSVVCCALYVAGCSLLGVVRLADVTYLRQAFARGERGA